MCFFFIIRTEASVRRVENVHKDQIQMIQKDGLRLLRALMHFRDQLVIALTKEGYIEPAHQLQELPKLIHDDFRVEVRNILINMTGNVVEYLHNIETIMAHTLKSIRVLNKPGAAQSKDDAKIKQMKNRVTEIKNAKEKSTDVAQRLTSNKQKIVEKEDEFKADHNDAKYLSLLNRYKLVWNMYKNLMKEMDILEIDFEDSLDGNAEIVSSLCVSTIKLKQAIEKHIIKTKSSKVRNKEKKRKDNSNKVKGQRELNDDNIQNIRKGRSIESVENITAKNRRKAQKIGSYENVENMRKGGNKTQQDITDDGNKSQQDITDNDNIYNKRKSGEPNRINDAGVTDSNLPGGQKKQTKPKVAREFEYKVKKRHIRRNKIILEEAVEEERISVDLYTKIVRNYWVVMSTYLQTNVQSYRIWYSVNGRN
ncbi:uncharacterized protein PF3D7_1120000 isoform X3 [Patella vulgata]|uniref:uncharacterized protein PF3D7_1120000 isoform X3 n=1 Tax=Patella vulgata TaxID=6465 RepID=UPI0024A96A83|nr:uncharacterized protein PF3D7_1120000 isoform X3 [Patella vulgata]